MNSTNITVDLGNCPVPSTDADINEGDTAWMVVASALVLLMTPGLAFFYGGMVRQKNVINTLMMSYTAMGVVMIQWVFFGYSFAFGPLNTGFGSFKWGGFRHVGGTPNADYAPTIPHIAYANFQMMFAVITPALISGSIVERMKFSTYIIFILCWTTIVYDPIAHWMWSGSSMYDDKGNCTYVVGWLRDLGAIDFAGGTVIHISSGFSGLIASYVLGARTGYDPKKPHAPYNVPFILLGAAILWFGWLGFNGGSALASDGLAALAATNTSIAAAAGFLTWILLDSIFQRRVSAVGGAAGAVIGMVTITPGSGFVEPGFAIIIGAVGVVICYFIIRFKNFWRADDSLDSFFCHGVGGVVGALMTGLFSTTTVNPYGSDGAFYGNPRLLGVQILAVLVTLNLSGVGTFVILMVLKHTIGLRTGEEFEEVGLDASEHKEIAHAAVTIPAQKEEGVSALLKVMTRTFSRRGLKDMRPRDMKSDEELAEISMTNSDDALNDGRTKKEKTDLIVTV